ncbi:hypothetical protein V5P93_004181 [Actinokineospora auranticolor]|uniref:Uncharacterized protein n=1 Tax=Actinokineospora auranticolor TaxID=155976 RepID=A0A2S6GIN5_9PSEU|nr:hypothetical protein [Actinokineospora auranticolor]PPK65075.1 hypothetical protein CLV40_116118 [Actinokineospora auranticolor]
MPYSPFATTPQDILGHKPPTGPTDLTGRLSPPLPAPTASAARTIRHGPDHGPGTGVRFAEMKAVAARAETDQQVRATRLVAGNSLDADDCRELLSMLGLTGVETTPTRRAR